jgi:hypothetical protein
MKTPIYYLGLYKRNKTMVLQCVENIDCLSCEIVEYLGLRYTTKKQLKSGKTILFDAFKKEYPYLKDCTKLIIE